VGWTEEIRRLSADDRQSLQGLRCAKIDEPWAFVVEESIQRALCDEISAGIATGFGTFVGAELVGVISLIDPPGGFHEATSSLLGVAVNYRARGIARALKLTVIEEARSRGHKYLSSIVHSQNTWMLHLNDQLGANIKPRPDPENPYRFDAEYYRCVIRL
jgi:GNAT superfamily N-acetyltransferase